MVAENCIDVAQYQRLQDEGTYLGVQPAVELVRGSVVPCCTGELADDEILTLLTQWSSSTASSKRHRVLAKSSVVFADKEMSALRPSMAWVSLDDPTRIAHAENANLVIEVPVTAPSGWLERRLRVCASAQIQEFWVVDPETATIIVHRDPDGSGYRSIISHDESATISPLCEPAAHLSIGTLFAAK